MGAASLAELLGECVPAAVAADAGSGGDGGSELGAVKVVDRGGVVKGGSIEDAFLWVFDNLDDGGVVAGDAPSPGAWTLLCDLRGDGKLRASFWTSIMTKFLPKNLGDGGDVEGEIDGTVQIKLIERIRKERDKAVR